PRCIVLPSATLYRVATALHVKTQYRLYDCLIVASALASDAKQLFSEDLQDGRMIDSLQIKNPF
ncbi:MAG: PIN domain-containing protein, partial [Verrucomicrobiales bacterium]